MTKISTKTEKEINRSFSYLVVDLRKNNQRRLPKLLYSIEKVKQKNVDNKKRQKIAIKKIYCCISLTLSLNTKIKLS